MGSWGGEDLWQGGGRQTGQSHICVQINQEEQLGATQTMGTQPRVPAQGNEVSKPLTEKNLWGLW